MQTEPLFYLNNCDELIKIMTDNYENPIIGNASFEGNNAEFNGYAVPDKGEHIPMNENSTEYFSVGEVNEVTNTFILTLSSSNDEGYGVKLPAYVRDELIATLKGEW